MLFNRNFGNHSSHAFLETVLLQAKHFSTPSFRTMLQYHYWTIVVESELPSPSYHNFLFATINFWHASPQRLSQTLGQAWSLSLNGPKQTIIFLSFSHILGQGFHHMLSFISYTDSLQSTSSQTNFNSNLSISKYITFKLLLS